MSLDQAEFWERATKVLFPCTPMEREIVVGGQGAWLTTADGRRLLDMGGGQVCSTFGHVNTAITQDICEQTARLAHIGARFCSERAVAAGEAVLRIVPPGLTKVAFVSTGTEANEFAVRLAKIATGRTGMAAPTHGYLGTSLMLRGLSEPFVEEPSAHPRPLQCHRFDWGAPGVSAKEAMIVARRVLDPVADTLAALILEPILGAHGILPLPDGLLSALSRYTQSIGALLIVDEAQTGMGRTGRWFACDHEEVRPDILVFSKCAGNGYPVACVAMTDAVADAVLCGGFFYLSSHQADPPALAAVEATIRVAESLDAPALAQRKGKKLAEGLRALCANYGLLTQVTGRGMLLGVHCADYGEVPAALVSRRLFQVALNHGVVLGFGDWGGCLLLAPPLCATDEELDLAVSVLEQTLQEVTLELVSGVQLPVWSMPPPPTRRFLEGLAHFRERQT